MAVSFANGRAPASALASIPGGMLRHDAAAAWNAMNAEAKRRWGIELRPLGPNSSYRTVTQQVLMKNLHGGNAATPGTSNHGWGLAVDVATKQMRWIIDQIGERYGWAKKWSDASWEWWHIRWREGVWKPPAADPTPMLRRGSTGAAVRKLQRALGVRPVNGQFGASTLRAVRAFQSKQNLKPDGVVGNSTWEALRRVHR